MKSETTQKLEDGIVMAMITLVGLATIGAIVFSIICSSPMPFFIATAVICVITIIGLIFRAIGIFSF